MENRIYKIYFKVQLPGVVYPCMSVGEYKGCPAEAVAKAFEVMKQREPDALSIEVVKIVDNTALVHEIRADYASRTYSGD